MSAVRPSWLDDRAGALIRVGLGALFVYAGVVKVLGVHGLADEVANYHLLPGGLVPLAAVTLPWVELAVGGAMILGTWSRGATLAVGVLLLVFIVAISQALARGIDLACGCFGGKAPADWTVVARDVALLGAAVYAYVVERGRFTIGALLRRSPA